MRMMIRLIILIIITILIIIITTTLTIDTDSYVWGGDSLVESGHQFVGHAPTRCDDDYGDEDNEGMVVLFIALISGLNGWMGLDGRIGVEGGG